MFAFTVGCPIGIDLEQIRPLHDMDHIAERFFCREEAAELMSLAQPERERAFYRCWTRKEAYIKALGGGLSIPLDSFCVTVSPDTAAHFVRVTNGADPALWSLHDFSIGSDYMSALAYFDKRRPIAVSPLLDTSALLVGSR